MTIEVDDIPKIAMGVVVVLVIAMVVIVGLAITYGVQEEKDDMRYLDDEDDGL